MTRFETHNPLHPVCAIVIKYKDGRIERNEFGAKNLMMQRMMHLRWDEVLTVEEIKL